MKFDRTYTLKEIAELTGGKIVGDENMTVTGINEIHKVEPGDIVFVDHPKYYGKALNSKADVIFIDQETTVPEGKALVVMDSPFDAFNELLRYFSPANPWTSDRGENFKVGAGTEIFPNVSIGNNVSIGDNCLIHSGVVLCDDTIIGNDVVIGPNAVIGHNAFYYKKKKWGFDRMHTCGRTILEDRVEIGALSTVDRGVTGDTIIGEGTKIDNQVHIGHDTVVGKNCLFAANVGIAGCVVIKDYVTLWGQVGVVSDVVLHDHVIVLGQSGVTKDLEANKTYFGSPAGEARVKWREIAAFQRLPSILENL